MQCSDVMNKNHKTKRIMSSHTRIVCRNAISAHTNTHRAERRRAKETSHRNQIDFLYHLAGSSHQNINTIFIDAATVPAAAATL